MADGRIETGQKDETSKIYAKLPKKRKFNYSELEEMEKTSEPVNTFQTDREPQCYLTQRSQNSAVNYARSIPSQRLQSEDVGMQETPEKTLALSLSGVDLNEWRGHRVLAKRDQVYLPGVIEKVEAFANVWIKFDGCEDESVLFTDVLGLGMDDIISDASPSIDQVASGDRVCVRVAKNSPDVHTEYVGGRVCDILTFSVKFRVKIDGDSNKEYTVSRSKLRLLHPPWLDELKQVLLALNLSSTRLQIHDMLPSGSAAISPLHHLPNKGFQSQFHDSCKKNKNYIESDYKIRKENGNTSSPIELRSETRQFSATYVRLQPGTPDKYEKGDIVCSPVKNCIGKQWSALGPENPCLKQKYFWEHSGSEDSNLQTNGQKETSDDSHIVTRAESEAANMLVPNKQAPPPSFKPSVRQSATVSVHNKTPLSSSLQSVNGLHLNIIRPESVQPGGIIASQSPLNEQPIDMSTSVRTLAVSWAVASKIVSPNDISSQNFSTRITSFDRNQDIKSRTSNNLWLSPDQPEVEVLMEKNPIQNTSNLIQHVNVHPNQLPVQKEMNDNTFKGVPSWQRLFPILSTVSPPSSILSPPLSPPPSFKPVEKCDGRMLTITNDDDVFKPETVDNLESGATNRKQGKSGKIPHQDNIQRPINAFLLFCKHQRPSLRLKYPDEDSRTIAKMLGMSWYALGPEEKQKYRRLASEIKEAHFKAYPGWKWSWKKNQRESSVKERRRESASGDEMTVEEILKNEQTHPSDIEKGDKTKCREFTSKEKVTESPIDEELCEENSAFSLSRLSFTETEQTELRQSPRDEKISPNDSLTNLTGISGFQPSKNSFEAVSKPEVIKSLVSPQKEKCLFSSEDHAQNLNMQPTNFHNLSPGHTDCSTGSQPNVEFMSKFTRTNAGFRKRQTDCSVSELPSLNTWNEIIIEEIACNKRPTLSQPLSERNVLEEEVCVLGSTPSQSGKRCQEETCKAEDVNSTGKTTKLVREKFFPPDFDVKAFRNDVDVDDAEPEKKKRNGHREISEQRCQLVIELFQSHGCYPSKQSTSKFQASHADVFPTKLSLQRKIRAVRQKIMKLGTPPSSTYYSPLTMRL